MAARRILVVRMGAMGDVLQTLPAAATLKVSFPGCDLAWVVDPKWVVLLEGNPYVDEIIPLDRRRIGSVLAVRRILANRGFDTVVDFQGLIKSALVASAARPETIYGFHQSQVRERLAALFYSHRVRVEARHVVDRNLELAAAAGASNVLLSFPMAPGKAEGKLPEGRFVLAAPLGGWQAKQWPFENYNRLAQILRRELNVPLVVNGAPSAAGLLDELTGCEKHISSLEGLIDATRRAVAVVGIDSGPIHLAAALSKPGVAIYGPTDPARNGPYGSTLTVLRDASATTTYKRRAAIDESMKRISPETVAEALAAKLCSGAHGCGGHG